MKIVLDVMGGDNAPIETVKGAILALEEIKGLEMILVKECITVDIDGFPVCSENCKGPENFEEHNNSGIDPRWQQLINITKENR